MTSQGLFPANRIHGGLDTSGDLGAPVKGEGAKRMGYPAPPTHLSCPLDLFSILDFSTEYTIWEMGSAAKTMFENHHPWGHALELSVPFQSALSLLDFVRPGYKSSLHLSSCVTSCKPPASGASCFLICRQGPATLAYKVTIRRRWTCMWTFTPSKCWLNEKPYQ